MNVIIPVFENSMCIVTSTSPAAPLVIMTFSVSGVLQNHAYLNPKEQTAIMFVMPDLDF